MDERTSPDHTPPALIRFLKCLPSGLEFLMTPDVRVSLANELWYVRLSTPDRIAIQPTRAVIAQFSTNPLDLMEIEGALREKIEEAPTVVIYSHESDLSVDFSAAVGRFTGRNLCDKIREWNDPAFMITHRPDQEDGPFNLLIMTGTSQMFVPYPSLAARVREFDDLPRPVLSKIVPVSSQLRPHTLCDVDVAAINGVLSDARVVVGAGAYTVTTDEGDLNVVMVRMECDDPSEVDHLWECMRHRIGEMVREDAIGCVLTTAEEFTAHPRVVLASQQLGYRDARSVASEYLPLWQDQPGGAPNVKLCEAIEGVMASFGLMGHYRVMVEKPTGSETPTVFVRVEHSPESVVAVSNCHFTDVATALSRIHPDICLGNYLVRQPRDQANGESAHATIRDALGDWSHVDPNDPRRGPIEQVMAEYGLSGKYSLMHLERGRGEELIVKINVTDIDDVNEPGIKFTTMAMVNMRLGQIDPLIKLETNFRPRGFGIGE